MVMSALTLAILLANDLAPLQPGKREDDGAESRTHQESREKFKGDHLHVSKRPGAAFFPEHADTGDFTTPSLHLLSHSQPHPPQ